MAAHIPASAFEIERLGPAHFTCDLCAGQQRLADETGRIVAYSDVPTLRACLAAGEPLPSFEIAGRRAELFFDPGRVKMGVVTCGGLCPGQNAVIRAVVLTAIFAYGAKEVLGFRYGYNGLSARPLAEPIPLDKSVVDNLHVSGGTLLASSRGAPNVPDMVDTLVRRGIDILFTIGGDGTLRGASAICAEIRKRNLPIAVVAIPKTIDNDILWVEQSFGFRTAVEEAYRAIQAAHAEARGAWNGVGLVKLMGRHSGFVAAHACLSNPDANFCLIPEVPFSLDGPGGFLEALEARLAARQHAVVVVAEGAGQSLLEETDPRAPHTDASGNVALKDIGVFLKQRIQAHLDQRELHGTIKYIDPSYIVRSMPPNPSDSKLCLMLGQNAVHAGMAGRTNVVIGYWNQHFTHVPIGLAVQARKQVEPEGDTWQAVLASTGQPPSMLATPRT